MAVLAEVGSFETQHQHLEGKDFRKIGVARITREAWATAMTYRSMPACGSGAWR